jgi:hypothetical protein
MSFLGQMTVAELRDLIAAKDYTIRQIDAARSAFNWPDQSAANDWNNDWRILKAKYAAAKLFAETAFARAKMAVGVNEDLVPAQLEWDAVLKSIRQNDNVQSKGDLQDLADRLQKAGKSVDYSHTPQPRRGTDVDLNLFQKLDKLPFPKTPKQMGTLAIVGGTLAAILGIKLILK